MPKETQMHVFYPDWLGGSRCGLMTWRHMIGQNTSPPTPSALLYPYPLTLSHTSTTRTISSPLSFSSHAPARPRRRRSFPPPPSPQHRRPTSSHLPRAPASAPSWTPPRRRLPGHSTPSRRRTWCSASSSLPTAADGLRTQLTRPRRRLRRPGADAEVEARAPGAAPPSSSTSSTTLPSSSRRTPRRARSTTPSSSTKSQSGGRGPCARSSTAILVVQLDRAAPSPSPAQPAPSPSQLVPTEWDGWDFFCDTWTRMPSA